MFKLTCFVDSGSSVDIIDERTLRWMRGRCSSLRLRPQSGKGLLIWKPQPTSTPGTILRKSVDRVIVDHGSLWGSSRRQWLHPRSTDSDNATPAMHGEGARVSEATLNPAGNKDTQLSQQQKHNFQLLRYYLLPLWHKEKWSQ